ncbi:MAG: adenylosuccinate lyase [Actinomycetota bacterium]
MIDRYTRPEMAAVFSDEARFGHWLRIEILATEARAERGEVPAGDLEEIKAKAAFDPRRVRDLERKTRHDVAAFLDNVAEVVGPAARHLHYGMTSSDVLDTALALQLRDAAGLLLGGAEQLIAAVVRVARTHAATLMAGRTHGIHAEPTTFGLKVAGWAFELDRGRQRLRRAREAVSVGKVSGVVGTYSQLDPSVEAYVCSRLGLEADPASTQVVSRDRHAEFAAALGILAASIERIATEIRHLARTEVREVEEPFAEGEQKGSSAMPHKRNPWRCERLCGLARLVRSFVGPALENVALWHERDISHSSVERVALPDACILVDFMLAETTEIVGGLVVHPEQMRANLDRSFGMLFSQSVLLRLIDAGMTRDEAYRLVQEAAMEASRRETHLAEILAGMPEIRRRLAEEEILASFDGGRYLQHTGVVIARLDELEEAEQ